MTSNVVVRRRQRAEGREAGVNAAVVDIDHLVRLAEISQDARQRLVEGEQIVLLVEHRDHDGEVHRGRGQTVGTVRITVHHDLSGSATGGVGRSIVHVGLRRQAS